MDLDGVCVRKEMVGGRLVLVPGDERAAEFIAKLTDKKDVLVTIRSPRNPDFHRWFFKYLSRIIEQTDDIWPDVETLLDAVKHAVGHTVRTRRITNPHAQDAVLANEISIEDIYVRRQGHGLNLGNVWFEKIDPSKVTKIVMALRRGADEYVVRTKSIAFANMGEEKFRAFKEKAVLALNSFLGWDTESVMRKDNET